MLMGTFKLRFCFANCSCSNGGECRFNLRRLGCLCQCFSQHSKYLPVARVHGGASPLAGSSHPQTPVEIDVWGPSLHPPTGITLILVHTIDLGLKLSTKMYSYKSNNRGVNVRYKLRGHMGQPFQSFRHHWRCRLYFWRPQPSGAQGRWR